MLFSDSFNHSERYIMAMLSKEVCEGFLVKESSVRGERGWIVNMPERRRKLGFFALLGEIAPNVALEPGTCVAFRFEMRQGMKCAVQVRSLTPSFAGEVKKNKTRNWIMGTAFFVVAVALGMYFKV